MNKVTEIQFINALDTDHYSDNLSKNVINYYTYYTNILIGCVRYLNDNTCEYFLNYV